MNGFADDFVTPFDCGAGADLSRLGGKCASLVTLTAAGVAVPDGFAVTTEAYREFVESGGVAERAFGRLDSLDVADTVALERAGAQVRERFGEAAIPTRVADAIKRGHAAFVARHGDVPVAVRSSATAEDLPDASFAGQQDTYLWMIGIDEVLGAVRRCWASLFTSRAISYRARLGIRHADVLMAVGVQKMIDARVAGVAMTLDPANGDRSKIAIEANYGCGELLVSGEVTPDHYLVDKVMLTEIRTRVARKTEMLVPDSAARTLERRPVPDGMRDARSLTPLEVTAVARLAKVAERHYRVPQDVEWAIAADAPDQSVVLLQSRPETAWTGRARSVSATPARVGIASVVDTLLAPIASTEK